MDWLGRVQQLEWSLANRCRRVLLSTHGVVTLVGCNDMAHTSGWLQASSLAGLERDVLVMLDGAGTEVARLELASAPD